MPNRTFESVKEKIDKEGMSCIADPDSNGLLLGVAGERGRFLCTVLVEPIPEQRIGDIIIALLHGNEVVPRERRTEALKMVNMINNRTPFGSFQIEPDGTICFHTSIVVPADELTQIMVRNLIFGNLAVMDRYYPVLMKFVRNGSEFAEESPEEELLGIPTDQMTVI